MNAKRENRRIIRVILDKPMTVKMGSIGSEVQYDMQTSNVSYNGFFLNFEKPGRFPFTPASIMEIWLELSDGNRIFFNGKMARIVYPDDPIASESGPGIAIRIVQIEKDHEQILRDFIDRILQETSQDPSSVA